MNIPENWKIDLEKIDKLPHYTDDNLSCRKSRLCLPMTLFYSAFDKVHEHSYAGVQSA